jgi:ribose-phosphate pyrophosphokinase
VNYKSFPDGELYVCLSRDIVDRDAVIIHSTGPPQNERFIQLFLLIDACRDMGVKNIRLVAPYLAYARQDRRRKIGEAVSILTLMKLLESLGVNELLTVNVHNPDIFKGMKIKIRNLSAIPLLAKYFRDQGLKGAFSLSLGKKDVDVEHAMNAAMILGGKYNRLKTFRDPDTGAVALEESSLEVDGKDAIIFDDVITTGRTHIKAIDILKKQGARRVYLACVHSLLSEEAQELILRVVEDFVCTDTVPNRFSKVSVAPLVAEALRSSVKSIP